MSFEVDVFGEASTGPVVISVPHAGRAYSSDIVEKLAVDLEDVRALEDRYADRLTASCIARGYHVIVATAPRLLVDLNRAETDFLPAAIAGADHRQARPTARARHGLGIVPERLPGPGALWRHITDVAELHERLETIHRPYHERLARALCQARAEHGCAMLLDLHSMPPLQDRQLSAQIILGDRHGRTASPDLIDVVTATCKGHGLRFAVNVPYAGGQIIEQHANRRDSIYALQIEIDRSLYLNERLDEPGPGLARMQCFVVALVSTLERTLIPDRIRSAAE